MTTKSLGGGQRVEIATRTQIDAIFKGLLEGITPDFRDV